MCVYECVRYVILEFSISQSESLELHKRLRALKSVMLIKAGGSVCVCLWLRCVFVYWFTRPFATDVCWLCVCVCTTEPCNNPACFPLQPLNMNFSFLTVPEKSYNYDSPIQHTIIMPCKMWDILWERKLQLCHSYFMLLLLKENSAQTQTPRQSTF